MQLDIQQIMRLLPHTFPFLLVDRVSDCNPGRDITAVKNVSINEPFFEGHFRDNPIMPGVLIIEAMAQASMLCIVGDTPKTETASRGVYFMAIDSAKFRKVVTPGDVLVLKSCVAHRRGRSCRFECKALVEDAVVSEAQILAMLTE
ncbi:3-hydroxyacyl-[acyl-carrier-protein] dehydratase FabZ [Anaplasma platys]|uniref:3-hydroxyacyl-[acyl-carrier-protein] dehydratase FabZ n=1 Tax=Anaplasma platys TaxID=949 RepID=A0A858PZ75_9RICK|nr:3-hydroxyacyl-ACP dehydratase FabZ [Anaplasma platys]QJC27867.1 3-hydroxyacyl-[acyl-carrier-protein] dehydratase FabZ [Anaplasma platys]